MLFVSLYYPIHNIDHKKTEGAIRNGKYRDTNNIDHKKTEGAIRNGKYRNTNNIDHKKIVSLYFPFLIAPSVFL
jgi:hypothetical protein